MKTTKNHRTTTDDIRSLIAVIDRARENGSAMNSDEMIRRIVCCIANGAQLDLRALSIAPDKIFLNDMFLLLCCYRPLLNQFDNGRLPQCYRGQI